ncbi:hypothetical protein [Actinacidiphila oryziradicis]|nr:hypothetical protein [Actinacidiphila oryziradicis]
MTHTPTPVAVPPAPDPHRPHQRQRAWAEVPGRLRTAGMTEPGRLRIIGSLLALLLVAFGTVTAWQVADRSAAADDVVNRSEPLSAQAADIYRSLADADTTAADGFLAGGLEPRAVRQRYENDIALASRNIADAAAKTSGSEEARAEIELLNRQLPVYTGLVETARANNKQGLPLGGAYLRYANGQMSNTILPAAKKLWDLETARLNDDYRRAKALPWAAWGLGVLALGGLVWAQRRSYHRTNRVFNQGLLAGSAATAVVLLWLVAGHSVARLQLDTSYNQGAKSLSLLNKARIESLQSRGDENLTLVARGAGAEYDNEFRSGMQSLAGKNADGRTGLLAQALALANDAKGRDSIKTAMKDAQAWWALNGKARASDDSGNYQDAVAQTIGGDLKSGKQAKEYTGICFDGVDASIEAAVAHEQQEFQHAANAGRGALTGLGAGAALLAVLGATGAVLGIGRRLSEYR